MSHAPPRCTAGAVSLAKNSGNSGQAPAALAVIALVNHFVRDSRKIDDLADDQHSRNRKK